MKRVRVGSVFASLVCASLTFAGPQAGQGTLNPGQSAPGQPGQVKPGQSQPGQAQPGQVQPGQVQPGRAQPVQVQPGQVQPGQVQPGQVQPGQVQPSQKRPGQDRPGQVQRGQNQDQNQDQANRAGNRGQRQGAALNDQVLAQCLAIDNQAEIEIAEQAKEHLKSNEAREFADMLIRDHREMIEKLKQAGATDVELQASDNDDRSRQSRESNSSSKPGTSERQGASSNDRQRDVAQVSGTESQNNDASARDRDSDNQAQDRNRQNARSDASSGEAQNQDRQGEGNARGGQQRMGTDVVSFKREVAQQCVNSAKRALSEKDGEDVDKAFIASQIFAHQHMHDMLTVVERHVGSELKQTISEGRKTTEEHLEHAKKLLKDMK